MRASEREAEAKPRRDLVVVGASAGGVQALQALLHDLPASLRAAVLVVLHTPPDVIGNTAQVLARAGPLPVIYPRDGAEITQGCVMVAPPDLHLVVDGSNVRVVRGPRENGVRPAIDPLFRSAAASYGPRVVGVLLSGTLDDGAEGMLAVQAAGGTTVAQDPQEALFPGMPLAAMRALAVDHVAPVGEIAKLLAQLSESGAREPAPPDAVRSSTAPDDAEELQGLEPTAPAAYICPECGGALADKSHDGVIRFQCHVGHTYGADSLLAYQTEALDRALWTALRTLEEAAALRRDMAGRALQRGLGALEDAYLRQATELEQRAEVIRAVVQRENLEVEPRE